MRYSIQNLDARYSVEQETALVGMPDWVAYCEEKILGFFRSRTMAEHACKWHNSEIMCVEEV